MATEKTPEEGMKVDVWTHDGQKVFSGVIDGVLIRPATGKAVEIVIKADAEPSDGT